MGVLECSRKGCGNIMSGRYSGRYGYICCECFRELISLGPEANINNFMESCKRSDCEQQAAKARFEVEFPEERGFIEALECDRENCNNEISGRYSTEYGYLCSECFEELISLGPEANIRRFIESCKQPDRKEAARARFEVEFPER